MHKHAPVTDYHLPRAKRWALGRTTAVMVLAWVVAGAAPARAGTPVRVSFDAREDITCRDVTTAEFRAAHPEEKVIEATLRVSMLIESGRQEDIDSVLIVFASPERRLRVVDFEPRTETATDVAGEIEVVDSSDSAGEAHATLGGAVSGELGIVRGTISPSIGATHSKSQVQQQKYQRIPPRQLVLASGTTNAEHGVFFKLKPSAQDSLEGMREYVCRFAVPAAWRADWATVACEARCRDNGYFGSKLKLAGMLEAVVTLHLEGDAAATRAVDRLNDLKLQYRGAGAHFERAGSGASYVALKPLDDGSLRRQPSHAEHLSLAQIVALCSGPFGSDDDPRGAPARRFYAHLNNLAVLSGSVQTTAARSALSRRRRPAHGPNTASRIARP